MNKKFCKIFGILLVVVVMVTSVFSHLPVKAASSDFSMKDFDKAYITFVFDDGKMPFSKECFELFESFKMPMGCALVANTLKYDEEAIEFFKKVEKAGGEIYSHTFNHKALHEDNSTIENIEKQLGDSYRILSGLGFDINGVIEAGIGGHEATADYELIETVSRKYYKYSNAYGLSPQYKKTRLWLMYNTLDSMKVHINEAVKKKQWLVIAAHSFDEFSKENMTQLLMHIDMLGKNKVEVVNWKYIYDNFGNYTGPKVPTKEAIESVCKTQGHDLKNVKIKQKATCEKNAVEEGDCKRCGKVGTREVEGTAGHKFGEYVSDNNATCTELATKTARCTVKGCNATDFIVDIESDYKHSYKTVTVKAATKDAEGLAENRCELCGDLKERITLPKLQSGQNTVNSGGQASSQESVNTPSNSGSNSKPQNSNNSSVSSAVGQAGGNAAKPNGQTSMSGNAAIGDSNNTQFQNNINSTPIGNDSLNASAVESGGQGAEDIIESDTQISSQENITIGAVDGSNETSKDGKKPLSPVLIAILIVVWVLLLVGIGVLVFILIKKKKGLL